MSRTTDVPEDSGSPPEPADETESAFRRWSRRKHRARAERDHPPAAPDPPDPTSAGAGNAVGERVLTDADMPPLDTLTESSDYSPFMSPGVSEKLRRAALRRLFRSPELNQLCELEGEYFDSRGFKPLGNIVTHDMRDALERELAKARSGVEENVRRQFGNTERSDAAASPVAKAPRAKRAVRTEPAPETVDSKPAPEPRKGPRGEA